MYSKMTKGGHALNVLFARLQLALGPAEDGWGEEERLRSVILLSTPGAPEID